MLKKLFPVLIGAGIGYAASKLISKANENTSSKEDHDNDDIPETQCGEAENEENTAAPEEKSCMKLLGGGELQS